jgi:hypothetical protein
MVGQRDRNHSTGTEGVEELDVNSRVEGKGDAEGGQDGRATDLALLSILVGVALAMQVAVELSPRQLAGVALHLEVFGSLLGDEQEVLNEG